ncbi:MAG: signal peptidase II [Desulfovibrio sp.]|jgi:signal peptidase II|nr:signal peptidase II [Desulfovibrio sp.]
MIVAAPALALFVLDQTSKHIVAGAVGYGKAVVVTVFFNLVHVRNFGAVFGILNDPELGVQVALFGVLTAVALAAVFFLVRSAGENETLLFFAMGLITGGALGNLADRLRLGAVTDFLDFHYGALHWPAFNAADAGLCIGAGLAALSMLRGPRRDGD